MVTRRGFLALAAAGPLFPGMKKLRIGAMDGILRMPGKPEAVALAARLGFDGIEVNIGRPAGGTLPLADPELQAKYLSEAKAHNIAICGVVVDALHVNYLKNDKLGAKWVADGIEIARKMNAGTLLVPFFGKGAIEAPAEQEYTADLVKELAPAAEKAGILMGLENTISAEENARMLERIGSKAVMVYYDVGNSTNIKGFDAPKEIRYLGRDRICQIHLKDRGYMGEGKVNFPEVMKALREIKYDRWLVLETSSPSKDVEADAKRQLEFTRALLEQFAV